MQPARLPPVSPHPTRTSPIRHGKRFGSLTVPEEHREAALKGEGTDLKNQKTPEQTLLGQSNIFVLIY